MRKLDQGLIDKIVETEKNLPTIDEINDDLKQKIWAAYPPDQKIHENLNYSWAVMDSARFQEVPGVKAMYDVAPSGNDPLPYEYVIAYIQCLTFRPELAEAIRLHTKMWREPERLADPEEYWHKYGDEMNMGPDYLPSKWRVYFYRQYFSGRYANQFNSDALERAFNRLAELGTVESVGAEAFLRALYCSFGKSVTKTLI